MFRFTFLSFLFLIFFIPNAVYAAEPTFLQKWLPALFPPDTGPGPEDTLQAPFSDSSGTGTAIEGLEWQGGAPNVPGEVLSDLDQPHRASNEISEWAVTQVSNVLSFNGNMDFNAEISRHKILFDAAGFQQYRDFMDKNNLTKVLESQKFDISSFVEQSPILLNEGAVEGRYRWLYEIPVMISYIDRSKKEYDEAEPVTQALVLRMQVGRSGQEGAGQDGLQIESWSGQLKKLEKQ